MRHRGHCTDIVAALFRRPHRFDPKSAAMYNHIVAVLRILRNDQDMRNQWERIAELLQPARPRGPVGVWKQYMKTLGIEEEAGRWTHTATKEVCAWETSEWGKVTHFLRATLRHRLLARAALKRVHLQGAENTNVETTVKSIRNRDGSHQGELRMLMADGVWTQRRRAAAGWVTDALCPFCDNKEEETLHHLLHECPAWARLRRWSEHFKTALTTMPNAGRLCGLCPKDASREVQSEWRAFQQGCASILAARVSSHRYVMGPRTKAEALQSDSRGDEQQEQGLRMNLLSGWPKGPRLQFQMTYTFGGQIRWHYTREQWHRLSWFASMITYPREEDLERMPHATYLEFTLSYVCANGGVRFHSGVGENQRGHWITSQMESFIGAWRAFSQLTNAPPLVAPRGAPVPKAEWGPQYGLTKLPCLAEKIVLPCWAQVTEMIQDFPRVRESLLQGDVKSRSVAWKRWTPGAAESQLAGGGGLPGVATTGVTRRIASKLESRWMQQAFTQKEVISTFKGRIAAQKAWPGTQKTVIQVINEMGVLNRAELLSIAAAQRISVKRASILIDHLREDNDQMHYVSDSEAPRVRCDKCGATGYYAWLKAKCPGTLPVNKSCILQRLQATKAQAQERAELLHQLTR